MQQQKRERGNLRELNLTKNNINQPEPFCLPAQYILEIPSQ